MTASAARAVPAPTTPRLRRVLGGLVSLVLVVGVFWYLVAHVADVSGVRRSIGAMTASELATLTVAAAVNLASYGWVLTASMPGLTFAQALVVTESSTAVSNTLPGGAAVGVATSWSMFSSWGFSRSRVTVSLLVSGLWNNLVKLGLPLLALAALAVQGGASTSRLLAAAGGVAALACAVALLVLVLRSEGAAQRTGELAGRCASALRRRLGRPEVGGWDAAVLKFRRRTVLLLRARWLRLTLATTASHLLLFAVLLLSLRHLGVGQAQVGWAEALAVFAFARLVTAVPLTPGGVGFVELALIAGLVTAGGPRVEVVSAVLVFRALTYVLPVPLGLLTWVVWRRRTSWRRAPGGAPRTALVPEA